MDNFRESALACLEECLIEAGITYTAWFETQGAPWIEYRHPVSGLQVCLSHYKPSGSIKTTYNIAFPPTDEQRLLIDAHNRTWFLIHHVKPTE